MTGKQKHCNILKVSLLLLLTTLLFTACKDSKAKSNVLVTKTVSKSKIANENTDTIKKSTQIKEVIKPIQKEPVNINVTSNDKKYTLTYNDKDNFVGLKIPKNEWDNFVNFRYYKQMSNNKCKGMTVSESWCNFLYENVEDKYDFVFYVLNTDTRPEKLFMNGYYQGVKNDTIGIGTNMDGATTYDYTKLYSKDVDRLQGIVYITHNDVIYDGPILHELLHRWGNYIINSDCGMPHWGNASIYGRLGGYKSIEEIENESRIMSYRRYWDGAYAPFELYLMGLIPKDDVPDITITEDYSKRIVDKTEWDRKNGTDILVTGKIKTKTYTIDQILAGHASNKNQKKNVGDRVPNYKDSQKEFNTLFVVIDHDDIVEKEKQSINKQIDLITYDGNFDDNIFNFWEACQGKATISADVYMK